MAPEKKYSIFISHTHSDQVIAHALNQVIEALFGDHITVNYSTSKELEGGIKSGEDWFRWITERVQAADISLILLTPASIQKPWVLWEAGAVAGVALATGTANLRKVRPLVYQIDSSQIPSPFQRVQTTRGDKFSEMEVFFSDLIANVLTIPTEIIQATQRLQRVLQTYQQTIEQALLNAPLLPTEANVQEWIVRLDRMKEENRMSEVKYLHDWMNIAFGREDEGRPIPLDLRLHRRLGELYLNAKNYEKAVEQFELARQLSPRDIFMLRQLGQAYLSRPDLEKTRQILQRIEELDGDAFKNNVECAAFKGRYYREQKNFQEAFKIYYEALDRNSNSYYLADLCGQMKLELEDVEGAKQVYRRVLEIIKRVGEKNIWVDATAATAAIVSGKEDLAIKHLKAIRESSPTPESLESIERGLETTQRKLNLDREIYNSYRSALYP
ncbi:MAG: TIR domain-containing protein [Prochloraceae cyanobacterium]|nr:TIR domain-containing protein [Prochloraceae cyanobacterium]